MGRGGNKGRKGQGRESKRKLATHGSFQKLASSIVTVFILCSDVRVLFVQARTVAKEGLVVLQL